MPQGKEDAYVALVEIVPPAFDVMHDIAYATSDNITGHPIYKRPACYLHEEAAICLKQAIIYAAELGLMLKIFDAYRPSEAQFILWEHTPDPAFLANPHKGSPHSRGVAVDLSLVTRDGVALDMGTPFDDFSQSSYHGASYISDDAKRNRLLLLGIMTSAGFDFYRNEWWHYQLFNSKSYPVLSDAAAGTAMM
ncbi:MAG: D-alanyl-D-alanine dipeptidase [Sphaerospermopsis sp. SIO1G2]|nr:D-alanyl-D-alanine dipeptidase [Sphaerospermopsis sp. SIO1G2]